MTPPDEILRSRRNPLLQQVRGLLERTRDRQQTGLAVLDGEHLLTDWLAAGRPVERLLLAVSRAGERARWQAAGAGVATLVDDDCLAAVSPAAAHAGLLAVVPVVAARPATAGCILALDGVQDPGNVGTLLRCAAACAIDQVWLGAGCADPWSWKVLRAAQGAHATLPVCPDIALAECLAAHSGRVVALVPTGGVPVFEADLRGDLVWLVGGEGAGIGPAAARAAALQISIPMPGRTESLNVAVAAAIAMYERVRQSLTNA